MISTICTGLHSVASTLSSRTAHIVDLRKHKLSERSKKYFKMVVLGKSASVVGLLSFGTMTSLFSKIGAPPLLDAPANRAG